jgi:twitching motility protein PilI
MAESCTAFELLLGIDQRCRLQAARLPALQSRLQGWSGIGFRLGEQWYVAPIGEVAEVLREPRATQVPGVKPWVRGVANVRGRLLPIISLGGYFGHDPAPPGKQRRVLVVDRQELFTGLLVDEVLGLQHFALHSHDLSAPAQVDAAVAPFIQGHFMRERPWSVFSPLALAQAPGFVDIAL